LCQRRVHRFTRGVPIPVRGSKHLVIGYTVNRAGKKLILQFYKEKEGRWRKIAKETIKPKELGYFLAKTRMHATVIPLGSCT